MIRTPPGRLLVALALASLVAVTAPTFAATTGVDPGTPASTEQPTPAPGAPARPPDDRQAATRQEREGKQEQGEVQEPEGVPGTEAETADAEQPTTGASSVTPAPGRTILGGLISRGIPQELNGSVDIDITTVALRWSRVFGAEDEHFLGAHPGIGIEVIPAMLFHQEPTAWAGGFHVLYEHRFVTEGVLPILRLGAGLVYGNREVPPGETRHNFSLLAGLGIDVPVGETTALGIEYRLHHVSNADTGVRNPGINAHTLAVALSVYF